MEEFLILNNISSVKDISSFIFVNRIIKPDDISCKDRNFLVKFEQYEILLNKVNLKPVKEFEQIIEEACNNIKPLDALQDVFNEYGHLFPLRIVLGRSFRNIIPNSLSNTFDKVNPESPIHESLKPYLNHLNIPYFLTHKGNIIKEDELSNLAEDLNNDFNDLEVIEFDNVISLYEILEEEQQRKISTILDDNFRITMTGITDLKDLDNNNTEHYKRINIESALEDENYEVFGSIISDGDSKREEFLLKFRLYDFNGFSAMIKTLRSTDINVNECYIIWMIIGSPSKLSVFSPKNRNLQVIYITESITLRPDEFSYYIKPPSPLSQGCYISINAYYSRTTYEPVNISLVGWSKDSVKIQIPESTYDNSNLNISTIFDSNSDYQHMYCEICILYSDYNDYKTIKIDYKEGDLTIKKKNIH